ncbi:hypothetical protein HMPREF1531_00363 [Propionibacterium sp. oral taxon 192 str. F0372]|uniref:hypothetical protein n=1 Tax=Propionibacterium sp. oral taxon 192 TaxID=671222 RepID=UPI000352CEA1|nr:hypothetical protein [Propionibacterium sp. oral taxon 192]EPH06761.1 hypothetical protein HMPREF1531_00363 [Propionibacterium sp. oral taxon 192 str. F0372]
MNRFTRTTAVLTTALVVLVVMTGCWRSKPGPGLPLDKQLDKIIAETGITQAHEIEVFLDTVMVHTTYQGTPHSLSLDNKELRVTELTDASSYLHFRGSAPLSDFDVPALIERYEQTKQSGNCEKPVATKLISLMGAHIEDMHCSAPEGDDRYLPGSTTIDGQPVIDSPDPFNPHDVATMATDRAKVIPNNGAITTWVIWLHEVSETAFLPRTTTIFGTVCIPYLSTSSVPAAATDLNCYRTSENDTPLDQNTPKPPTFRLSDYDPNLVNIAAQHIKEESGIDITQPMPSGSNLEFNPNPDGSNTITWRFASILLGTRMQITGTLTPIT